MLRISDRRSWLRHAQGALLVAALIITPVAAGAGAQAGSRCLTILYPNGADVRFDFDYYRDRHLPLIMDLYKGAISRFELRRGLPGPDGAPPPHVATVTIWIADQMAFDEAGAKYRQSLMDDIPNFSSVMPVVQMDELYGVAQP